MLGCMRILEGLEEGRRGYCGVRGVKGIKLRLYPAKKRPNYNFEIQTKLTLC